MSDRKRREIKTEPFERTYIIDSSPEMWGGQNYKQNTDEKTGGTTREETSNKSEQVKGTAVPVKKELSEKPYKRDVTLGPASDKSEQKQENVNPKARESKKTGLETVKVDNPVKGARRKKIAKQVPGNVQYRENEEGTNEYGGTAVTGHGKAGSVIKTPDVPYDKKAQDRRMEIRDANLKYQDEYYNKSLNEFNKNSRTYNDLQELETNPEKVFARYSSIGLAKGTMDEAWVKDTREKLQKRYGQEKLAFDNHWKQKWEEEKDKYDFEPERKEEHLTAMRHNERVQEAYKSAQAEGYEGTIEEYIDKVDKDPKFEDLRKEIGEDIGDAEDKMRISNESHMAAMRENERVKETYKYAQLAGFKGSLDEYIKKVDTEPKFEQFRKEIEADVISAGYRIEGEKPKDRNVELPSNRFYVDPEARKKARREYLSRAKDVDELYERYNTMLMGPEKDPKKVITKDQFLDKLENDPELAREKAQIEKDHAANLKLIDDYGYDSTATDRYWQDKESPPVSEYTNPTYEPDKRYNELLNDANLKMKYNNDVKSGKFTGSFEEYANAALQREGLNNKKRHNIRRDLMLKDEELRKEYEGLSDAEKSKVGTFEKYIDNRLNELEKTDRFKEGMGRIENLVNERWNDYDDLGGNYAEPNHQEFTAPADDSENDPHYRELHNIDNAYFRSLYDRDVKSGKFTGSYEDYVHVEMGKEREKERKRHNIYKDLMLNDRDLLLEYSVSKERTDNPNLTYEEYVENRLKAMESNDPNAQKDREKYEKMVNEKWDEYDDLGLSHSSPTEATQDANSDEVKSDETKPNGTNGGGAPATSDQSLDEAAETLNINKGKMSSIVNNLYKTWGGGILDAVGSVSGLVDAAMTIIGRASAVNPSMTGLNEARAAVDEVEMHGQLGDKVANDLVNMVQNISNAEQRKKAEDLIRATSNILSNTLRMVNPSAKSVDDLSPAEMAAYSVIASRALEPLANATLAIGGKSEAGRYLNDYVQSMYKAVQDRSQVNYDDSKLRMAELRNIEHKSDLAFLTKFDSTTAMVTNDAQQTVQNLLNSSNKMDNAIGLMAHIANYLHSKGAAGVGDGTMGEINDNKWFSHDDTTGSISPTTAMLKDTIAFLYDSSESWKNIMSRSDRDDLLNIVERQWGPSQENRLMFEARAKANAIINSDEPYAVNYALGYGGRADKDKYHRNDGIFSINGVPLERTLVSKTMQVSMGLADGMADELRAHGIVTETQRTTISPSDPPEVIRLKNLYIMNKNMQEACHAVMDFNDYCGMIDKTAMIIEKDARGRPVRARDSRTGEVMLDFAGQPMEVLKLLEPGDKEALKSALRAALVYDIKKRTYRLDNTVINSDTTTAQYMPFREGHGDRFYQTAAGISKVAGINGMPKRSGTATTSHNYNNQSFVPAMYLSKLVEIKDIEKHVKAAAQNTAVSAASMGSTTNDILRELRNQSPTLEQTKKILASLKAYTQNVVGPDVEKIRGALAPAGSTNIPDEIRNALQDYMDAYSALIDDKVDDIDEMINNNAAFDEINTKMEEIVSKMKSEGENVGGVLNLLEEVKQNCSNSVRVFVTNQAAPSGSHRETATAGVRDAINKGLRATDIVKTILPKGSMSLLDYTDAADFDQKFNDMLATYEYAKAAGDVSALDKLSKYICKSIVLRTFGVPDARKGGWHAAPGLTPLIDLNNPGAGTSDEYTPDIGLFGTKFTDKAQLYAAMGRFASEMFLKGNAAPTSMQAGTYDTAGDQLSPTNIKKFLTLVMKMNP